MRPAPHRSTHLLCEEVHHLRAPRQAASPALVQLRSPLAKTHLKQLPDVAPLEREEGQEKGDQPDLEREMGPGRVEGVLTFHPNDHTPALDAQPCSTAAPREPPVPSIRTPQLPPLPRPSLVHATNHPCNSAAAAALAPF